MGGGGGKVAWQLYTHHSWCRMTGQSINLHQSVIGYNNDYRVEHCTERSEVGRKRRTCTKSKTHTWDMLHTDHIHPLTNSIVVSGGKCVQATKLAPDIAFAL